MTTEAYLWEQRAGKTPHETPSSENYKTTQNKNNTRTTALERSVA